MNTQSEPTLWHSQAWLCFTKELLARNSNQGQKIFLVSWKRTYRVNHGSAFDRRCELAQSQRKNLGRTARGQHRRNHHARHRPEFLRSFHPSAQRTGRRTRRRPHSFFSHDPRRAHHARRTNRLHPFDGRTFRAQTWPPPDRLPRAVRLNCVILNHNARPHLDGSQSNHAIASRLPSDFFDSDFLRTLPLGASRSRSRRTKRRNRWPARAQTKSALFARRLSRSDRGQAAAFFFVRDFGHEEGNCVVAHNYCAESRHSHPGGRGGNHFDFRLSPISSERPWEGYNHVADCSCLYHRVGRGISKFASCAHQ